MLTRRLLLLVGVKDCELCFCCCCFDKPKARKEHIHRESVWRQSQSERERERKMSQRAAPLFQVRRATSNASPHHLTSPARAPIVDRLPLYLHSLFLFVCSLRVESTFRYVDVDVEILIKINSQYQLVIFYLYLSSREAIKARSPRLPPLRVRGGRVVDISLKAATQLPPPTFKLTHG